MTQLILGLDNAEYVSGSLEQIIPNGWPRDSVILDRFIEEQKNLNNHDIIFGVNSKEEVLSKMRDGSLSSIFTRHTISWTMDVYLTRDMCILQRVEDIKEGNKYVYPMAIRGSAFYQTPLFHDQGIFISDKVKYDARVGNCKILFHELLEGHGQNELWVQRFISRQCEIHNLPFESMGFLDCNFKTPELQNNYNTKGFFMPWWESHSPTPDEDVISNRIEFLKNPTTREKYFLSLNRRVRIHRSILVYNIIKHWQDKFLFSYDKPQITESMFLDINTPINYADDMLIKNGLLTRNIYQQLPKIIDVTFDVNDTHVKESLQDEVYINVVTETSFFENDRLFFSEKVFKPILFLQPFILLGNFRSLELLKKMGYKTFHPFINESYDLISDNEQRMNAILNEIERLSKFSHDQMIDLIKNVSDVCIHNYKNIIHNRDNYIRQRTLIDELITWVG